MVQQDETKNIRSLPLLLPIVKKNPHSYVMLGKKLFNFLCTIFSFFASSPTDRLRMRKCAHPSREPELEPHQLPAGLCLWPECDVQVQARPPLQPRLFCRVPRIVLSAGWNVERWRWGSATLHIATRQVPQSHNS